MKFRFKVTESLPKKDFLFIRKIPPNCDGIAAPAKLAATIRYGNTYTEKERLGWDEQECSYSDIEYQRGGIPVQTFERWMDKFIKEHPKKEIVFGDVESMLEGFTPK